jgi:hypothetical protein
MYYLVYSQFCSFTSYSLLPLPFNLWKQGFKPPYNGVPGWNSTLELITVTHGQLDISLLVHLDAWLIKAEEVGMCVYMILFAKLTHYGG